MMKGGFDSEYASLMAELGETGKGSGGDGGRWGGGTGHDITAGGSNVPPWRRPEVWQSAPPPNQQGGGPGGFRPPGPFNGYGGAPGAYGGSGAPGWNGQAGYGQQGGASGYYPQGQDYGAGYAQYYQNQYSQQQVGTPAH